MKNQVIKVLNEEHGKRVIKFWQSKGVNTTSYLGDATEQNNNEYIYYGIIDDKFGNYLFSVIKHNNVEIIELSNENTYPKVMWVWGNDIINPKTCKRVVFMEKCGKYLAWRNSETIKDSMNEPYVTIWHNAEDILEEIVELTIEDIFAGKGVGVPIYLLRIKQ